VAREIEVVYENGVFKPLQPVALEEGHRLKLYIPYETSDPTREQQEELVRRAQEAFGELTDEEWAEIAQSWKRGNQCPAFGTRT
jgi:predicted DNA-binding antitoxin AbrB/MazE fold protein